MPGEFDFLDKHMQEAGVDVTQESAGDTNTAEPQQGTPAQRQEPSTKQKQSGQEQPVAKQDSSSSNVNAGEQQGKKEEAQKSSGPKDLTLPNGEVIKGGKERRFYEQKQLAEQQRDMIARERDSLNMQLNELRTKNAANEAVIQQLNVENPQDIGNALRLFKDLRNNPVDTLKKLLAEATAGGYSIDNIAAGIDTSVIKNIVTDAIRTVQGNSQTQVRDFEAEAAAEVDQFFGQFPDARIHEDAIAAISAQHPQASLSDIYFRLKEQVIERGLDWTQPLGPQVNPQNRQPQQQHQQPQQGQPPMLNGRVAPGVDFDERTPLNKPAYSESTEDIIKAAMRDAGFKI